MLTVLGSLLGLVTGILPGVLEFFNKRENNAHELKMMEATANNAERLAQLKINAINVTADATEGDSLRRHDSSIDGGSTIDAFRASVRPVITYILFGLFVAIKVIAVIDIMSTGNQSLVDALPQIWNGETEALFAAIISFWFGNRTIEKMRAHSAHTFHITNPIY